MAYAYLVGGLAAWGLACIPFLALARSASTEPPTPMRDVSAAAEAAPAKTRRIRDAETVVAV